MTNIAMWSGPRNISTAMMYSFGNRADCVAWDEPFYGAYLKTSGLVHPMRDEIIRACKTDWQDIEDVCVRDSIKPVFYQKHMTQHMLPNADRKFIRRLTNAFLIRSPEKVLASYAKKHEQVTLHAIGFVEQAEIFDLVCDHLGYAPPVIDADLFLSAPEATLKKLCAALNITFDPAMLHWSKGPKSFDGVWAPHWYNAVWQSTGFEKPTDRGVTLESSLLKVADEARPHYEKLKAFAL